MQIIEADKKYTKQIFTLLEESFGSGYLSEHKINSYIQGQVPFKIAVEGTLPPAQQCLNAFGNAPGTGADHAKHISNYLPDRVLGAILFIPAADEDIEAHTEMDGETIRGIRGNRKGLICRCASTKAGYQKKGIAKRILEACLDEIKNQGYGAVFTVLWEYNGSVPAENLFQEFGFVRGRKLAMPWYDKNSDYVCRICNGTCRCSGIVYYKSL